MKEHRGTSYDLSSFWHQDVEPHYSILGISVDPRSQMCSLALIAWVIPAAVILQVPTPHNRSCSASLNRSELISPGCCSRFRHLLSEGRDYGSTYGHSYIILCRCVSTAKNSSEMLVCFSLLVHFTSAYSMIFFTLNWHCQMSEQCVFQPVSVMTIESLLMWLRLTVLWHSGSDWEACGRVNIDNCGRGETSADFANIETIWTVRLSCVSTKIRVRTWLLFGV